MKHIYDNNPSPQPSTDEQLANRLRELSESYEPEFVVADWQAMQNKLQQYQSKVTYRKLVYRTVGVAASLLLFLGLGWQLSTKDFENNDFEAQVTESNNLQNESINESIIENNPSANKTLAKRTASQNTSGVKKQRIAQANISSKNGVNKDLANSSGTALSATTSRILSSKEQSQPLLSAMTLKKPALTSPSTISEEVLMLSTTDIDESQIDVLGNPFVEPSLIGISSDLEVIQPIALVSSKSKWSFGAAIASVTNFYKSDKQNKTNHNLAYGIEIDRYIAPKWSLSLGALYNRKQFGMREPSEIPVIANQVDYQELEEEVGWIRKHYTDVNWELIDIPLNVRYDAIQTPKTKWFVSTGVSNLIFLKEDYESDYSISYADTYDPRLTRTQSFVSQRETEAVMQPLAMLNVSMGLETSIGRRLTIQVEPYWSYPLRSLGSEGVFVQTGGLLTRINFTR